MDNDQKQFLRNLLHQILHMALGATIWRLPTVVLLAIIAGAIYLIWHYRLF